MKNDIADDLEWRLKVISGTVDCFSVCVSQKYNFYNVRKSITERSDIRRQLYTVVFDRKDCYVIRERDLLAIANFLVY